MSLKRRLNHLLSLTIPVIAKYHGFGGTLRRGLSQNRLGVDAKGLNKPIPGHSLMILDLEKFFVG
jgi:hypothetical protein